MPEGQIKGVVQIVHGIAEHAQRYDGFARFLNSLGYLVVAEDHMGHGMSGGAGCIQGYFHGGWFSAVDDTYQLLKDTMADNPNVPYIIFGHSMGSFMARTLLIRYPNSGISGAILCGTGWMNEMVLQMGHFVAKAACRFADEKKPNGFLHDLMFGSYNLHVEHPRTSFDWLNRDTAQVSRYIDDPLCGFMETAGLARDMLGGLLFIQNKGNLMKMKKDLPVYFIAGGDDPVGDYGAGVTKAADQFRNVGMVDVKGKLYPLCRHEILNEINHEEVYQDVAAWLNDIML